MKQLIGGGSGPAITAVPAGTAAAPSIAFEGDSNTGIYSPGADQIGIATGGTARITVDSSGNVNIDSGTFYVDAANNRVGIGTTSLSVKLEARDSIAGGSDGTIATLHNFSDTGGDTRYAGLNFRIGSDNGTSAIRAARTLSSTDYRTDLSFWTNPSGATQTPVRAMTIDYLQRVAIGTIASPAHQLQVSTDSAGKPSTSTWTIVSDERIKEDIELADLDLCYEAIKAIPLKRYKWRDEIYTAEQVTDRRKLGWIAQDVETVFPKAVGTHEFKYNQVFAETIIPAVEEELDADGNIITPAQPERIEQGDLISEDVIEDCRNLNSDQIYAAMYGAVQKLMAKVETLEASNADLLARVAALG